jgi:P27 family predicted phage terminase small subunit
MPRTGRPPKPIEQKKRLGNPGKRPLPDPVLAVVPADVTHINGHGPKDGMELVQALMDAGAKEWVSETDALATMRLVKEAWDERARLKDIIDEEGYTQIVKDRVWARPEVSMLREVEKQLTVWLAQLGLNPADRGRLGLAKVQAKATGLAALREERALKAGRPAG